MSLEPPSSGRACANREILESLTSSLDRMQEAEWFIRMMEEHYHCADHFRWCLNSFLRTLKEVLPLVSKEIQNNKEAVSWFKEEKRKLAREPLLAFLFKQRDVVVHQSMLVPASNGFIGFTRGRGLKLGMGMPIDPMEDSKAAILRYIDYAARNKDVMGILYSEEDGSGEYTCVERTWRLDKFPEREIIELAAAAWIKVAKLTLSVAEQLGAAVVEPTFTPQDTGRVRFEIYRPAWIKQQMDAAKKRHQHATGKRP